MACTVCGDPHTIARDRCPTCWKYHQRKGTDRTEQLIARLTQRDIEREAIRRRANRG